MVLEKTLLQIEEQLFVAHPFDSNFHYSNNRLRIYSFLIKATDCLCAAIEFTKCAP